MHPRPCLLCSYPQQHPPLLGVIERLTTCMLLVLLLLQSGSGVQTPRSEASDVSEDAQHYLERHLARVAAGRGGGLVPAHIAEQLGEHPVVRPGPARGRLAREQLGRVLFEEGPD
jgi:hypothetical protein